MLRQQRCGMRPRSASGEVVAQHGGCDEAAHFATLVISWSKMASAWAVDASLSKRKSREIPVVDVPLSKALQTALK